MNSMLKTLFISMIWFTGIFSMSKEELLDNAIPHIELLKAIEKNSVSLLQELLKQHGEDIVHAGDPDGLTPIMHAAKSGKVACVVFLLRHNTDLNETNEEGFTPLHLAAANGKVDCVRTLVKCGADIDARDNDGSTPLHVAAREGHGGCVRALASRGSNLKVRTVDGDTPSEVAKRYGYTVLHSLLTLMREDSCSFCGTSGCKACIGCLSVGYCGAECQRKDWPTHREKCLKKKYSGKILLAIKKNDSVKLRELGLQEKGLFIDPDYFNFAVRSACLKFLKPTGKADDTSKDSVEVIRALIELGADVNVPHNNHVPLWYAVLSGHVELITLLLDSGSEMNFQDTVGMTPLHGAASLGNSEVVDLLLASKASVVDNDNADHTPLFYAKKGGYESVVALIEKALLKVCQVCKTSDGTIQLCAGCQSVAYCSTVCQKKDWKEHKRKCKNEPKKKNLASEPDYSSLDFIFPVALLDKDGKGFHLTVTMPEGFRSVLPLKDLVNAQRKEFIPTHDKDMNLWTEMVTLRAIIGLGIKASLWTQEIEQNITRTGGPAQVLLHKKYDYENYSESKIIISYPQHGRKVILYAHYYSGKLDCAEFHYAIALNKTMTEQEALKKFEAFVDKHVKIIDTRLV